MGNFPQYLIYINPVKYAHIYVLYFVVVIHYFVVDIFRVIPLRKSILAT